MSNLVGLLPMSRVYNKGVGKMSCTGGKIAENVDKFLQGFLSRKKITVLKIISIS